MPSFLLRRSLLPRTEENASADEALRDSRTPAGANVQAEAASGRLHVHNDRDGAAFDAFAEADSATACEACVRESLQHAGIILLATLVRASRAAP